jgi:hypothetical protein
MVPHPAAAQVAGIAASTSIGGLIDQLESAVRNTINRADDAVSNNSFRIRQQGEVLLSQLDTIATGQREKTFAQLNATEQKSFLDIKTTVDQLARLERLTAADVQRTTNSVGTAMANLPLGKSTPRVIDYGPAYVVASRAGGGPSSQIVTISGMTLGEGTPKLRMKSVDCALLAKTEIAIKFSCPSQGWTTNGRVDTVSGELQVFQKRGWIAWLLRAKPAARPYKLSVFLVPSALGTYKLAVTRKVTTTETKVRSQDFRADNGHCDGDREALFPFNATPGWTIDTASIKPNCDSSSKSSCEGLRNVTANSFGFMGVVRNSGNCVRIFHQIVSYDARGNVRGNVTWSETRPVETMVTEPASSGALEWGKSLQLQLPSGVQSTSLTIDQVDGKRIIVTGNDSSQDWYTVQSDPTTSFMIVSPRSLDQAMAR